MTAATERSLAGDASTSSRIGRLRVHRRRLGRSLRDAGAATWSRRRTRARTSRANCSKAASSFARRRRGRRHARRSAPATRGPSWPTAHDAGRRSRVAAARAEELCRADGGVRRIGARATRVRPRARRAASSASARASASGTRCFRARPAPIRRAAPRSAKRRRACPTSPTMGFDVLYLPPIHPIGRSFRKGPQQRARRRARRSRQPVGDRLGRGRPHGGRAGARHPRRLRPRSSTPRERLGLEIALDIAFQCSPDHPWVREHPEWFRHRPGRHDQVRREPAEEVPGHLSARLRVRRLARRSGRSCSDVFAVLDRARRPHLPRRQPAHQAVPLLGVGDRRDPARRTRTRSSWPRRSRGRR